MTENSTAARYRRLGNLFGLTVEGLGADDWDQPSPCAEWSAREVLEHVLASEADVVTKIGLSINRSVGVDIVMDTEDVAFAHTFLDGMGQMFYDYGASAPALPMPDDASPQDRLLGRAGRDPQWAAQGSAS